MTTTLPQLLRDSASACPSATAVQDPERREAESRITVWYSTPSVLRMLAEYVYRHPLVTEAAVIAAPDEETGVLIKAFLSISNGSRPCLVEMKRFCMEQLPSYMIPDRFIFPGPLPKTSTEKIDYQRLREIAL